MPSALAFYHSLAMEDEPNMVIAVTGATSGMGKACAEELSASGHRVYGTVFGMEMDPAWEALPYTLIPCDITDQEAVETFSARIRDEAGRIDVLVNCAGFGLEGGVEDTTVEEAKSQFEVNLFGTHRIIREVLPSMRRQGGGKIITVSSFAGQVPAIPFQGFYSMSKKALDGLTEALRIECRPFGVQATSINPGDVRTDFTGHRKRAAALTPESPYHERSIQSIDAMRESEMSSQGPEVIARLVRRLVEQRTLRPKYFVEPKYKAFLFLMRFMSNARVEKLIESIYCRSKSMEEAS
jgi:NAD(P)-dependent dehydrogenase (short-subunit alcohol dehydrogenase family)